MKKHFSYFQPYSMLKKLIQGAAVLTALFLLVGCGASRKNHGQRLILQGIDSLKDPLVDVPEMKIQQGDLLTILVYSDSKDATEIFNQPQQGGGGGAGGSGGGAAMASMGRGYQVDARGAIYFHSLGLIKAEGLTKQQLAELLREKLKLYLQNPYVTVRFTNARISVLGEVTKPGIIEMPDQKMSILDAIGFAGDLTPFSRRDNILLVREENGKRVYTRIDLQKAEVYKSPYFYLQQNDLVYVEPTRKKPTGSEQVLMRNIAIGTSIISVVTLLVTLITR